MHAAGGRKYAGPLLEIVRARGPDEVVPPLEDLHARYDNVEHDDDDGDYDAASAAPPFPLGGLLLGGLLVVQGRSLRKFFCYIFIRRVVRVSVDHSSGCLWPL